MIGAFKKAPRVVTRTHALISGVKEVFDKKVTFELRLEKNVKKLNEVRNWGELYLWGENISVGLRWEGDRLTQDETGELGRRQTMGGLCRCRQGVIDIF